MNLQWWGYSHRHLLWWYSHRHPLCWFSCSHLLCSHSHSCPLCCCPSCWCWHPSCCHLHRHLLSGVQWLLSWCSCRCLSCAVRAAVSHAVISRTGIHTGVHCSGIGIGIHCCWHSDQSTPEKLTVNNQFQGALYSPIMYIPCYCCKVSIFNQ